MTISLRSIRLLMQKVVPGRKISEDAVRLLVQHLEHKARELSIQASRIHDKENSLRDQLGERHKVILSHEHMRMAIDGKFKVQGEAPIND